MACQAIDCGRTWTVTGAALQALWAKMPALQREAAVAAEKQLLEANARRRAEEQLLTVGMPSQKAQLCLSDCSAVLYLFSCPKFLR